MKKLLLSMFILFSAFLFLNFSEQVNESKSELTGTLIDNQGRTFKVKSISIGSSKSYKRISNVAVYERPSNKDTDPHGQTSYIDLGKVNEIIQPNPGIKTTFKGKEYVDIRIISNSGKTKHDYIIENDQKLWYDIIEDPSETESKIDIALIKKLSIVRPAQDITSEETEKKTSEAVENTTKKILREIDVLANKEPEQKDKFTPLKDDIVSLMEKLKQSLKNIK